MTKRTDSVLDALEQTTNALSEVAKHAVIYAAIVGHSPECNTMIWPVRCTCGYQDLVAAINHLGKVTSHKIPNAIEAVPNGNSDNSD